MNYTHDDATVWNAIGVKRSASTSTSPKKCGGYLVKIQPMDLRSSLLKVNDDHFVIGRDPQNDLQVRDSSVSRYHAVIEKRGDALEITDLRSTNGLFVNNERVTKTVLQNGDQIQIGGHIFKFLAADHVDAEPRDANTSNATRDGLTGLLNKRYFADALGREIEHVAVAGHNLSLALFDIDHLRRINDTYGRLSGDEVLQEFAQRLMRVVPSDAVLARLGGEEFGLILAEFGKQEALHTCERARLAIASSPFSTTAGAIPVTVSIGLLTVRGGNLEANELAAAADELLYESKQSGRNRTTAKERIAAQRDAKSPSRS